MLVCFRLLMEEVLTRRDHSNFFAPTISLTQIHTNAMTQREVIRKKRVTGNNRKEKRISNSKIWTKLKKDQYYTAAAAAKSFQSCPTLWTP